jgi:hypothetical protein
MEAAQPADWRAEYRKNGFVDLREGFQKSGFADPWRNSNEPVSSIALNKYFTLYGSVELQTRLEEAKRDRRQGDAFARANAQANVNVGAIEAEIRAVQDAIRQKTFFAEFTYRVFDSSVRVLGNESSCAILINAGISGGVGNARFLFPVPNVVATGEPGGASISFTVRGDTNSIQELVRNRGNYRVIIRFTNLRHNPHALATTAIADILAVEIVRIGDTPEPNFVALNAAIFGVTVPSGISSTFASYATRPESRDIPFVGEFTFTPAFVDGNRILRINSRFTSSEAGEVLFPDDLNVTGNVVLDNQGTALVLSLNGDTDDIAKLIPANYGTRVWFRNLQRNNRTHSADVQKIEIVRIR